MFDLGAIINRHQRVPTRFERSYNCYPMAFTGKANLEDGDKILLPASALHELAGMNVEYPLLFQLSNPRMGKKTHCGVSEFTAEEGRCYVPYWMTSNNLMLEEGGILQVSNVSLKKAQFVKFRPQSVDFINEISNPRVVLEKALRSFTCVTVGDQICINYNNKKYYLDIREVNPDGAASIIETDCSVDFEEPVGYRESIQREQQAKAAAILAATPAVRPPSRELQKAKVTDSEADGKSVGGKSSFQAFSGGAYRVDGKKTSDSKGTAAATAVSNSSGGVAVAPGKPSTSNSTIIVDDQVVAPRVSVIGDKYSKKKSAVSAFTGQGNVLKK